MKPVDHLGVPTGFRHSRIEAARLGVCARCGEAVDLDSMEPIDAAEWQISAICPSCWAVVMVEDE